MPVVESAGEGEATCAALNQLKVSPNSNRKS